MIEIAIAIAVIGFALVAIIGVLPTGLNVQKDNREDTIINQDGPYLLEAIRGGEHGLHFLTNYFDSITIETVGTGTNRTRIYTNTMINGDWLTNGEVIVGLLGIPKFQPNPIKTNEFLTNNVTAHLRAMTGSALEQGNNSAAVALNYFLRSEVVTYNAFDTDRTNYLYQPYNWPSTNAPDIAMWQPRSNYWWQAQVLSSNLYEIRLKLSWPLFPNGNIGPNRQVFRTLVSGRENKTIYFWDQTNPTNQLGPSASDYFYFFKPENYTETQGGS